MNKWINGSETTNRWIKDKWVKWIRNKDKWNKAKSKWIKDKWMNGSEVKKINGSGKYSLNEARING